MKRNVIGKTLISPLSLGSPCSFELRGDQIVGRFLGFIPIRKIHLANINYLRLATRDEVHPIYLLLNWSHFFSSRRTSCPVYLLQTGKRGKILLKLKGDMHFKLRQVIGRHNQRPKRMAA